MNFKNKLNCWIYVVPTISNFDFLIIWKERGVLFLLSYIWRSRYDIFNAFKIKIIPTIHRLLESSNNITFCPNFSLIKSIANSTKTWASDKKSVPIHVICKSLKNLFQVIQFKNHQPKGRKQIVLKSSHWGNFKSKNTYHYNIAIIFPTD